MDEGRLAWGRGGRLGYSLLRDFFFQEEGSIDFCKTVAYLLGNMRGFQGGRRFWRGLKEGVIGEWGLAGSGALRPPSPDIPAPPPSVPGLWVCPGLCVRFVSLKMTILSLTWTELGTVISSPGAMRPT